MPGSRKLQLSQSMQELILFSRADLERSIPSMVDGLKPGQRKILFACFKRNLKKEIKVCIIPASRCFSRWCDSSWLM